MGNRESCSTTLTNERLGKPTMGKNQNKNSIFARFNNLIRAKINTAIDKAEDPQEMLNQLIRDYKEEIRVAEGNVAEVIGNLRIMESDHKKEQAKVQEWQVKAQAASDKADEFRAQAEKLEVGDLARTEAEAQADKFDGLARIALKNRTNAEKTAEKLEAQIKVATPRVDSLKGQLSDAREKLAAAHHQRDELLARHKTNEAMGRILDATSSINVNGTNLSSPLNEWEERIAREEARLQGRQEIMADPVKDGFDELDSLAVDSALDDELAKLKANNKK